METHLSFSSISTQRLRLRPLSSKNAADVLAIIDPAMLDFLPAMLTGAKLAKFLRTDGDFYTGAWDLNNELLGVIGLHSYPGDRFELSYFLARRATGAGFAIEATNELVKQFEARRIGHLVAQVRASNISSQRLLKHLHFEPASKEVAVERGYGLYIKSASLAGSST